MPSKTLLHNGGYNCAYFFKIQTKYYKKKIWANSSARYNKRF